MEKDLYQGRRWDHRKGKQGEDKKAKSVPSKKFANDALSVLNKSMKGAWVVKKGTQVVSKHKTKDEADVKAMKHPLYKVYATEEVAVNAAGGGNVAGLGVGPQGEPGVKKKKKNIMTFSRFMRK